jgi:hypothetical protein
LQSQVEEFARRSSPDIDMASQNEREEEQREEKFALREEEEELEEDDIAMSLTPGQRQAAKSPVGASQL